MDQLNLALKRFGYCLRRQAGQPIELLDEDDNVLTTFATLTDASEFVEALEAAGPLADWRDATQPPTKPAFPKGRWTQ